MLAVRSAAALSRRAVFLPVAQRALSTAVSRRMYPFTSSSATHIPEANLSTNVGDEHSNIKPQLPAGPQTGRNMDRRLQDVEGEADLLPEGAAVGTVPSDLEQATGLERLEILGKMQGVDIFDMKPLPADRLGTLKDPIMVRSFGEEQYLGCTGVPVDSHTTLWLTVWPVLTPVRQCTNVCDRRRSPAKDRSSAARNAARAT